ncbi:hypothetical protein HAX54_051588, partial [Datura stramonium]|nr:hypothetical protein [Datura stramonium]
LITNRSERSWEDTEKAVKVKSHTTDGSYGLYELTMDRIVWSWKESEKLTKIGLRTKGNRTDRTFYGQFILYDRALRFRNNDEVSRKQRSGSTTRRIV